MDIGIAQEHLGKRAEAIECANSALKVFSQIKKPDSEEIGAKIEGLD